MKNHNRKFHSQFNKMVSFLIVSLVLMLLFLSEVINAQETIQVSETEKSSNKIFVVTNRSLLHDSADHLVFQHNLSESGQHYYLSANQFGGSWIYQEEESLKNLIRGNQNQNNWLIFIHGDGKTLQASVDRAKEIQDLHQVNVLVYSWPSKNPDVGAIKNFKNSYSNVEESVEGFSDFLGELGTLNLSENNPLSGKNVSLFFHSLGNYYLERMVKDDYHQGLTEEYFDNLIINAAAVEQEDHHLWVEQLNISRRIYINSNDDDFSLSGLRVLTRLGRQLGESAKAPFASNATYVDFTEAVGFPGSMGPSHSYYFASITEKSEKIKNYYTTIFHGEEAPLFNSELFAWETEQPHYIIQF